MGWSVIISHWQTYWQHIGESVPDTSWRVGRIEILVASLRSRDDSWRQEVWLLQDWSWWPKDISSRKSRILMWKRETETRTDLQWELRPREKQKEKANKMQKKQPRERRLHPLDQEEAKDHVEKHAHSSMTRTRKSEGRDDSVHCTETRKVAEKVAMTEALKDHQHLLVKSPSGKAKSQLCANFLKGSCPKGKFMYFLACSRMNTVQSYRWMPIRSVHTNTQQNLLLKRKIQHRFVFTFHQMMNDRCKNGKISRMTRPNTEWDFIILRTNTFTKKRNWALHLESSSLDLKISEVQTLQHSKRDLSNGPCAWKKKQGQQLGFHTRTCTRFQVHILTIEICSSNQVPRAMFLQSPSLRRKRERREHHFKWWVREIYLTPEEQETIQKSKDSSVIMISNDTTHTIEKGTVCALNMFVQVHFFKKSPAVLSLGKFCEGNGYSLEWYPGRPSYLKCNTDNHITLAVPGVHAAAHQTKTLDDWKRTQAVGDHEPSVETQSTRMASTITEGLTRGPSSSTDVDRKGSWWRSRFLTASQICSGCARLGDAMDSKLSMKNQNQLKRRREIPENSDVKKKTQGPWIRTNLCFFIVACEELNWNHERSMPRRSETNGSAERVVRHCKKAGGQKPWSVIASPKCARPTSRCPDTSWTTVQVTIWWADHSIWSISKILSNIIKKT